jgi:signal transduction histidine kinase
MSELKRISLTKRLIVAVVMSQLLLAVALVIVASFYCFHHLQSAFDVNLEGHALSVAALVYYPDDGRPGLLFDATKIPPAHHIIHKDIYFVRSNRGNVLAHAGEDDPRLFNGLPAEGRYWDFDQAGERYRAIILRDLPILDKERNVSYPLPRLTVMYAAPTMDISQRIGGLAGWIAFASILLVTPSLMLSVWSIRHTLVPLNNLAHEAQLISVDNWQFRPSDEAKAARELQPLIDAIETVLAGLQRAFKRQREFLGDAAHELKTSFTILKTSWQSLLNQPRTAEEYRVGLTQMSEDGDRLEQLLNRMLMLARTEQWAADGIHRDLDIIDLVATCEMAIARIKKLADERNIKIELVGPESVLMRADPADIELLWLNFLENAVKASSAGSRVEVILTHEGNRATVQVSDEGCGIPVEELPHIFERFRRGDPSRSRTTGGFGLGLAIANSIVEAYKGTIHAESKLGEGTQIWVRLPVENASPTADENPQEARLPHSVRLLARENPR